MRGIRGHVSRIMQVCIPALERGNEGNMVKRHCDRCDVVITEAIRNIPLRDLVQEDVGIETQLDLCPTCYGEFEALLQKWFASATVEGK